MTDSEKLDKIIQILSSIETRQINAVAMVEEKIEETPVVGSFGTVDKKEG